MSTYIFHCGILILGGGQRRGKKKIVVYLFRSTDDVSLSLIPLVHVVDQEETGYGVGHRLRVSSPLPWGMGDAYDVCGASMCPWDMEGGVWSPLGSFRPLFNDFRADTTL